jgi:hypothetical protein
MQTRARVLFSSSHQSSIVHTPSCPSQHLEGLYREGIPHDTGRLDSMNFTCEVNFFIGDNGSNSSVRKRCFYLPERKPAAQRRGAVRFKMPNFDCLRLWNGYLVSVTGD